MSLRARRIFRFGSFRLDPELRRLYRDDQIVPLRPRVLDTLLMLAEKSGEVVSKESLLDGVWPDTVVEENNLNQNILALRRVLEADSGNGVRIETLPRRGYRLIAPPSEDSEERAPLAPPPVIPPIGLAAPAPAKESAENAEKTEETRKGDRTRVARSLWRLHRLVWSAAIVLFVALAAGWALNRTHAPRPISGVHSIAVLPLKSIGAGGEEPLGLGLADAVITRLGYVRSLSVRPTSSVRALGAPGVDPVAAGRTLRVDAVLDGQIQKSADRVRVTVQLVGVREGSALWSEKFDVRAADLFTLEDSISEAVVRALASGISAGETARVGRDRPTNPDAYRAFLEGRYFWNQRTVPANERARHLFDRAIALDPQYAPAYAGLADALNSQRADPRRARQAAEKALALDDSLAEAHTSLANTFLFSDWDPDAAGKSFRRALDLNPSYATAHQWYAYCFVLRGDVASALAESRRAQQADPLSPSISVDVGLMLYYGRRYDDAIVELRRVLDLQPGFGQAIQALQLVLLKKGDLAAARRECPSPSSADPELASACLAVLAAHSGDRAEAARRLEGVVGPERWIPEALVAVALGDRNRAMAALENGRRIHSASLLVVGADPLFDDLRADTRFRRLLREIGAKPVEESSAHID